MKNGLSRRDKVKTNSEPHRTADLCLLLCPGRAIRKLKWSHYEAIRRKTGCYILCVNHAIHWFYEPDGWIGNTVAPFKKDGTLKRILAKPERREGVGYFSRHGFDRFLINHFYPGFKMLTMKSVLNCGLRAVEVARDVIKAKEVILCGLNMSSFNFCHSMWNRKNGIKFDLEQPKNNEWRVYNTRHPVNPKDVRRKGFKIKRIGGTFPCQYIKPLKLLERFGVYPPRPLAEFREKA